MRFDVIISSCQRRCRTKQYIYQREREREKNCINFRCTNSIRSPPKAFGKSLNRSSSFADQRVFKNFNHCIMVYALVNLAQAFAVGGTKSQKHEDSRNTLDVVLYARKSVPTTVFFVTCGEYVPRSSLVLVYIPCNKRLT